MEEEEKEGRIDMKTYTFFMEYLGGTYVSQIDAENYQQARNMWINQLDYEVIFKAKENFKDELSESFVLPPTPLEGIEKTWSSSGAVDNNPVTMHFTETAK